MNAQDKLAAIATELKGGGFKNTDPNYTEEAYKLIQAAITCLNLVTPNDRKELQTHSDQWRVWQDDVKTVKLVDVIAWYDQRIATLTAQLNEREKE